MYNFSFVILNYKTIKETKECVNSILKNIENSRYNIIVVDNGSNDGTGIKLKKIYRENRKVYILMTNENLGFAKGNNYGCDFAIKEFNPDFLFVINNDTVIEQNNILQLIIDEYLESKFDILGPDIKTLNNSHQNPSYSVLQDYNELILHLKRMRKLIILNKLNLDKFYHIIRKWKSYFFDLTQKDNKLLTRKTNVPLHGSALIFSKEYIEKYENVFNKSTFMFGEEEFLNYRRKRDNLLFVYNPKIKIIHKEDATSDFIFKKEYEKRKFIYNNSYESIKKLIETIDRDIENGDYIV